MRPTTKENITIFVICLVAIVLIIGAYFFTSTELNEDRTIQVNDIEIIKQDAQEYSINCNITPLVEYNYIQIDIMFYDENDNPLEQSSEVWNINAPEPYTPIDAQGTATISAQDPPAYATVLVYKNFNRNFGDEIYNETVNITNA